MPNNPAPEGDLNPIDRTVLLSHAPADRDRVLPLMRALERAGWSVVDSNREGAIDRARCVIAFWSQHSVESVVVQAEAEAGRKRSLLLPVLLDDVQMPPAFRSMQAVKLVGWTGGQHPELNALIGAATLLALPPQAIPEANKVPIGLLDHAKGEIHIKIVFCGPASAGKTKQLMQLYESISSGRRGKLISLRTMPEPTIFFDFRPLDFAQLHGLDVRLHLYSAPAGDDYDASRQLLLKGAAGLVFVADPSASQIDDNLASLEELRGFLAARGVAYDAMPLVFQYDTPDLTDTPAFDRLRLRLNSRGAPETVTSSGTGVLESLRTVVRLVFLRSNYPESAPVGRIATNLPV